MLNFVTGPVLPWPFCNWRKLVILRIIQENFCCWLEVRTLVTSHTALRLAISDQNYWVTTWYLILNYSKRKDTFPTPIVVTYLKDYLSLVSNIFSVLSILAFSIWCLRIILLFWWQGIYNRKLELLFIRWY
jgi:hypothetical protein